MNRRERRAASARARATDERPTTASIADLAVEADRAYQQGRLAPAEIICRQVLAHAPAHKMCLNLLGLINQVSGQHRRAVKLFVKAIDADDMDASFHYNIASSYQILNQGGAAAEHFKMAIVLGFGENNIEDFVMKNAVVFDRVRQIMDGSLLAHQRLLFDSRDIVAIADDVFIRCALETTIIRGVRLELFFTHLRAALLRFAHDTILHPVEVDEGVVALVCGLALQCFSNEYVFIQSDEEAQLAGQLRELLEQRLSIGEGIPPLLLGAVAAYFPLYSLASAKLLLAADWPDFAADLLCRQVREPLQEAEDRSSIPMLTAIDDSTSLEVMQQYEGNPYPRWTISPRDIRAENKKEHADAGIGELHGSREILIAGCGTGKHVFIVAQRFPGACILACDLSRASLA